MIIQCSNQEPPDASIELIRDEVVTETDRVADVLEVSHGVSGEGDVSILIRDHEYDQSLLLALTRDHP